MLHKLNVWWRNKQLVERERAWTSWMLLAASSIGLLASFVLSVEAIQLAKNPDAILPCSLNSVLNCATVGNHWSSAAFGFPNSFLGMMAFSALITIAVARIAGVAFPRWFMVGLQFGAVAGIVFAGWMFYMSYAVIQTLCPWCLTLDFAMLFVFFAVTRNNIREGICPLRTAWRDRAKKIIDTQYDAVVLVLVAVVACALIIGKYGDGLF